jgi:ABC-type Mn2+/Zn2+ transport system ATPase subunit
VLLPYTQHKATTLYSATALAVEDLFVAYPDSDDAALQGVSLEVPTGQRVALVGANGSGKSTLLKAVAGLLRPQRGQIRLFGRPQGACHHRVAYLPQRSEIDWRFPISLERLVLAGRYVHLGWFRRPTQADRAKVATVLERLGLRELAQRQIGELSGGQQQRAMLARALVQGAELLLLDEPLSAVDAASRRIIAAVLDEQRRQGHSALVATHHIDRLDEEFDAVVSLEDGRVSAFAMI